MQRNADRRGRQAVRATLGRQLFAIYMSVCMFGTGCQFPYARKSVIHKSHEECYDDVISEVVGQTDRPNTCPSTSDSAAATPEPRTLLTALPEDDDSKYWDLSLQEAIQFGLANSRILNDLGGSLLRNPDNVPSNMMSAIVQSDPRFGIEGALSAFDTRFNVSSRIENNDTAYNNLFLSGGNTGRTFTQQLDTTTTELVKQTVTGGQVAVRNVTIFDRNSAPNNLFGSSYTTYYEAEARQSLLQGGGVDYNRIAGPYGLPGYYNGVKIARLKADISQAEFEIALRDYLSNVENAYWDLHFAYRDLASKVELRDLALEVYGLYKNRIDSGISTDEKFRLAQVREQYYRFQEDVQNSLTGRRVEGTRTNNGTVPGTFRGSTGVYLAERRLRLLMGVPTSDSRLIRPADEASTVEIALNWEFVKSEALTRRPELHRQKFQVKRAELELVASRNFLKPRLDLVGKYRLRGFGQDLIGYNNDPNSADPKERFNNAYSNLATGQFQESQLGVEFSMPLGYRQGHAAVAQAEFRVARERALLAEQERQIVHDVGNAVADLTRTAAVIKTARHRRSAAGEYLEGLTNRIRLRNFGPSDLEQWVEAERRFAEADTQFHLTLCEHQIATKNVNYERGSLLDYCNVQPIDGIARSSVERSGIEQVAAAVTETAGQPVTNEPVDESSSTPESLPIIRQQSDAAEDEFEADSERAE